MGARTEAQLTNHHNRMTAEQQQRGKQEVERARRMLRAVRAIQHEAGKHVNVNVAPTPTASRNQGAGDG